jgi:hypothetical protein
MRTTSFSASQPRRLNASCVRQSGRSAAAVARRRRALAVILPLFLALSMPAASAHAQHAPVGLGDEQSKMFASPLWQQLHTTIARYIAPYDAAVRRGSLARARAWIQAAEAQGQVIVVAFYHSESTPTRLPSARAYEHEVRRFIRLFPRVRAYQAWNEANRGSERGRFSSPSAQTDARYYQALRRACPGCTVVGLDLLDQEKPDSTLRYIAQFKQEVRRLRTVMPTLWGLHDYSDVNRLQSWRTRKIGHALGGSIWLTETGGIVQYAHAFRNRNGSGLSRAAKVIGYTLALISHDRQIKRAYIYDWSGATSRARFDAGLTDSAGHARPGYRVLCRYLLHNSGSCQVATSRH